MKKIKEYLRLMITSHSGISSNKTGYRSTLNNMKSFDKAYERYMAKKK